MNSELIFTSVFNGIKPFFPYFIFLIIFVFGISILKALFRRKSQNRLFANTNFEAVPLLNKSEIKVYDALQENIEVATNNKFKVFAQVSLGEILKNQDFRSFSRINQKRADFCIVDDNYMPIAIIEYHGGGHFKNNYKERDEIKQQATELAGLIYHAIYEKDLRDINEHIQLVIMPLLSNNRAKPVRKTKKNERVEPTF